MRQNQRVTENLAKLGSEHALGGSAAAGGPPGQALADEFLRRRAGGLPRRDGETALASLAAFSGGKQATLIGRRERLDALGAAFLNAAGANVLDFCDTHVPTAIHPTAPLAPALLGARRAASR